MKRFLILLSVIVLTVSNFNSVAYAKTKYTKIKSPIYVYKSSAYTARRIGDMRPQRVVVFKKKSNGWQYVQYKDIHGKKRKGWIAPSGRKIKYTKAFTVYDKPSRYQSKTKQLPKGTYTIVGQTLTGWAILKVKGKLYYKQNGAQNITLTGSKNAYATANTTTPKGTVAKGTYPIIQAAANSWIRIKVKGQLLWISTLKPVRSDEKTIFANAAKIVKGLEGGHSNHPYDNGSQTMYGITQTVFNDYLKKLGLPAKNVSLITAAQVNDIYYKTYFVPARANRMSANLATVMMDTAINFGNGTAYAIFQRALGIGPGVTNWGELTEYSFNLLPTSQQNELARRIIAERIRSRYNIVAKNPKQKVFLKGWIARDEKLKSKLKL